MTTLLSIQTKTSERIAELLKEKNMKQRELADRMFISEALVSRWVNGHRMPSVIDIFYMARIFDTTTDYLIGATDERNRKCLTE